MIQRRLDTDEHNCMAKFLEFLSSVRRVFTDLSSGLSNLLSKQIHRIENQKKKLKDNLFYFIFVTCTSAANVSVLYYAALNM